MTKIFLPTEIGVSGEGSNSTIRDEHTPDVHEVLPGEEPAVQEQPEAYKRVYDVEKDGDGLTLAEQRTGVENTRNQAAWDVAPKDGEEDPLRKPVELGELAGAGNTLAARSVSPTKEAPTKAEADKK